ncbi:MAG: dihydrodipicolinate synthase family protein [Acidobacteria bacterium]|nr:dihydrodipicolinate synthase family protein [Acidobacteriota bacterium]
MYAISNRVGAMSGAAVEYTNKEVKAWGKKKFKGLEVPVFPSFSPDLQKLDEEGIRWDVNHIYQNGFNSVMAAPEACGLTFEERKQFVQIVCDEAKGKMFASAAVMQDTVEEDIEMLHHLERVGATHVKLGHPIQYYPRSEEDMYQEYKYMCDSTKLAIMFYIGRMHTYKFHHSYFPPDVMKRIAEIPNVFSMQVTGGSSITVTVQAFELVGDQLLVCDPMPDRWLFTIPMYGQQWAGTGPFYNMQTPENPRMVRLWNHLVRGERQQAMDMMWESARPGPAGSLGDSYFHTGIVSCHSDKYMHWLVGGNGGTVRQPTGRLYDYQKEGIRAAVRAMGITPREPEEEFYVGRVNYTKGYRLASYEDRKRRSPM